jgi:hypothetical protein
LAKTSAVLPNAESARLLGLAVSKSRRYDAVPLPIAFIRSEDTSIPPPLARLLRGGRGGEVRLKLYLCICLRATQAPYDIRRAGPSRSWAQMLALPDPERNGARRIADALNWLDQAKLIKLQRRGGSPAIQLLSVTGDGGGYQPRGERWVSLPLGLWTEQWITSLSGSALALLLVLLELQGGRKSPAEAPWASGDQKARYGLSEATWTRATKELRAQGLLTVRRITQGQDFDWRRMRHTYWVTIQRLDSPPDALVASPAGASGVSAL